MQNSSTNTILYCQAIKNYTLFVYENGKNEVFSYTMKRFETQIYKESNSYVRLHRSWLVNIRFIDSVVKKGDGFQVRMVNGQEIPISRRRYRKYADVLKSKYLLA